ncbi:tryptophan synthase subunit alpha [Pseudobacteriovorax antillogorgiicola]|uniref:Tryptophan synthase alpha chain n=1 Tax=Pseudobacteriovorax antillogorgiicola TaxID=1513793 RepID=A0A1Y6BAV7_9BACT|nr:tryptophan synthase subunit alpha [Pseudobacteriovorax antillogorgiicola]TCS58878.1 tryptophan synthase alpha chain [Pseudobacteriovorax antillogorgiicola]SME93757.1 tryptophan synthase, alpha chain [Pseudobacteriovorax antillogorgiicola]
MSISRVFEMLKSDEKKAFVAYITAGDPDLNTTKELCRTLVSSGVDIIELGVPFSDPLADGPTNQKASERALASGTDLKSILRTVKELRDEGFDTPIVLFSYLNPIFAMGFEGFAKACRSSGVDGALVLDLPPEEAEDYIEAMRSQELDTVFLASPTTTRERLELINRESRGFVYYVSRTGVTGVQQDVSETLDQEIANLKDSIKKPVVIGFGISTPEQAKKVGALGEGIVIGSAIVKMVENYHDQANTIDKIADFVKGISNVLKS